MGSELLQQVRLLDPVADRDQVADVLIVDNRVAAIDDHLSDYPADTTILSGQGLVLGPGLVDLYSQASEPGFEEREPLRSLLQAAAAGGFTRLTVLPNTHPALDNPGAIAWLQQQAAQTSGVAAHSFPCPHLHCWAALTLNAQGQQMTELAELSTAGIAGFADGRSLKNWALVRRGLEYVQPLGKPVALVVCDGELAGNGVMREGWESMQMGLPGVPTIAETAPLAALLECLETIGTPVHLMRVSTARSVELIAAAKARGLPITASTTWMHLLLDSGDLAGYDPNLRLNPPLGNPHDRQALVQAVQTGTLDAIAVDHTPYTYEEKTVAFAEAPPGAIGLELALSLLWQQLVQPGILSPLDLWRSLSTRPAQCLQQPLPTIALGQPAELTLFDPQKNWRVEGTMLHSPALNTSWLNQTIQGRVVKTWCPSLG